MDYYSIEGNKHLDKVFLTLLKRYIDAVENEHLPNYFMR